MAKTDELEADPKNDDETEGRRGLEDPDPRRARASRRGRRALRGGWVALAQVDDRASSVAESKLRSYETRLTAVEERQAADASITNHRLDELQNEVREGAAGDPRARKDLRELFPDFETEATSDRCARSRSGPSSPRGHARNRGRRPRVLGPWSTVSWCLRAPATVAIYSPAGSGARRLERDHPDTDAPGRLARSQAWPRRPTLGEDYSAIFTFVCERDHLLRARVVRRREATARRARLSRRHARVAANLLEHVRALGLAGVKSDLRGFAIAGHVHLCNRLRRRRSGPRSSRIVDTHLANQPFYALPHFVNAASLRLGRPLRQATRGRGAHRRGLRGSRRAQDRSR